MRLHLLLLNVHLSSLHLQIFCSWSILYLALNSWTSILAAEDIESEEHCIGESGGLLFTGEVESVHLAGVTPLMESGRGLVVLESLNYRIVDDHLLVLKFDTHHTESVTGCVVVDVDSTEALLPGFNGYPLLTGVIIDHDRGSGLTYTLFTHVSVFISS